MQQDKEQFGHLPDAELAVMRIVWQAHAPVTSGDIFDRIEPRGRWAKTTMLNFLIRLERRGFVQVSKQGKCNVYVALVDEDGYIAQETERLLRQLHDGSLTKMLSLLYDSGVVDDDDLADVSRYIVRHHNKAEEIEAVADKSGRWKNWYQRHFRARE